MDFVTEERRGWTTREFGDWTQRAILLQYVLETAGKSIESAHLYFVGPHARFCLTVLGH